ncbi:MAG: patatin-like phospholipase family protein [Jatrophihabitans sp.]|uniref:patatin-like phospholipase family protein n=1 Tax=Jatrophihabitans sp. TaxID=1932789 RepID=UPI003F7D46EA
MGGYDTRHRTALVLRAGAALGASWTVGALCALHQVEGFEPAEVDLLVGTSAGSILAALLALGHTPLGLAERVAGDLPSDLVGTAPVNALDVHDFVDDALGNIPTPVLLPSSARMAARVVTHPLRYPLMTMAAALAPRGRGTLAPVHAFVERETVGRAWPVEPQLWITATEVPAGRLTVFGRAGAPQVPLADAVVASCAAPGYFPPVTVGGRSYVDGGAVSVTNADLVVDAPVDEVLVLAPMSMFDCAPAETLPGWVERRLRGHLTRRLQQEVARLVRSGRTVRVLGPTVEDLAVMGHNVMDPRRRRAVLETAIRTTTDRLTRDATGQAGRPVGSTTTARSASTVTSSQ